MGLIYCITNKANGKVYVGQTTMSLKEKFEWYMSGHRVPPLLNRAVVKYGALNFSISVLEHVIFEEDLDSCEIFWIAKMKATDPLRGYNLTVGGTGGAMTGEALAKLRKPKSEAAKFNICASRMKLDPSLRSTLAKHASDCADRGYLKGRIFSEETKRQMSESARLRARSLEGQERLARARAARGVQLRDADTGKFTSATVEEVNHQ